MIEKAQTLSFSSRIRACGNVLATCLELTKPRLTLLSVLSALLGFYLGSDGPVDGSRMLHLFCGAFLIGGGANAFNQFFERDTDARMRRTEKRPLPSGRLTEEQAFNFGLIISVTGIMELLIFVNALASILSVLILTSYVFFYTPLKRKTPLSTLVGAVPGALPPVLGWAAARGSLGREPLVLFLIIFFWQMPHFLAIAWMYREDYRNAGFPLLATRDEQAVKTARQITGYSFALLSVSVLPAVLGIAGGIYLAAALAFGGLFLWAGLSRSRWGANRYTRWCFLASILYLSLLMLVMMVDKQ